jgi:ubiquinone/menaquinone biosynthesis C-methylase UbiE
VLEGFFPATAMPDPGWWQALWPQPGEVLAKLGIERGGDAVDLCCGDGLFTIPLASTARRVTGIDIDPEMVELARDRAAAAGVTNCTFIVGDAYDLAELVPGLLDLVLIANTFHGVPDKARLVNATAGVLKPGGRFAIINWHRRPREETTVLGQPRGPKTEMRMEPADVAAAVQPAGLSLVGVVELPPYHYAVIFERPTR